MIPLKGVNRGTEYLISCVNYYVGTVFVMTVYVFWLFCFFLKKSRIGIVDKSDGGFEVEEV